jgi:hypothetical protein
MGGTDVRRISFLLLSSFLLVSMSGCLGTMVQSPTRPARAESTTRAHILAAPTGIDASHCKAGVSEVFTYVPLWGLAVGILTFGIIVPMTTTYSCVATE